MECLLVDPKERPMLLAEQCSNTQEQRERAAELMFEKYKVPALFLAKNAVLTSFASGRATSLVVDSLSLIIAFVTVVAKRPSTIVISEVIFRTASRLSCARAVTVAVISSPIGGQFLTECLTRSLEAKGITPRPRYSFKKKEISPGNLQVLYSIVAPRGLQLCGRTIMTWNKDSIFTFSSLMPTLEKASDCAPKNVVPNNVVANALLSSDVPAKKLARQFDFTGFDEMTLQSHSAYVRAERDRMVLDIKVKLQGLWLRLLKLGATDDPLSSFEYGTILALIESDAEGIGGSGFVECIREHINSGWDCHLTEEQFIAVKELVKDVIQLWVQVFPCNLNVGHLHLPHSRAIALGVRGIVGELA
ncbi:hypothetical protein V8G54_031125 [Vigna mungo]|uniref:Uncharacterized protein n=1 Tax=Vigna mungo TaxID=3915 RepID=A0AAQ3MY13_VIGMU